MNIATANILLKAFYRANLNNPDSSINKHYSYGYSLIGYCWAVSRINPAIFRKDYFPIIDDGKPEPEITSGYSYSSCSFIYYDDFEKDIDREIVSYLIS